MFRSNFLINLLFLSLSTSVFAQNVAEKNTELFYKKIVHNNVVLRQFLNDFPKGAELHYHPSGSSLTENLLEYAKNDGLCLNKTTFEAYSNDKCHFADLLTNVKNDEKAYDDLLDAWSMHHFISKKESGHDHFFAAFRKFGVITGNHLNEIIAENITRAASQNVIYMELLITPDRNESSILGSKMKYDANFDNMRTVLVKNNIQKIVNKITDKLNDIENKKRSLLACDDKQNKACYVKIRYLYQVHREQDKQRVFAQIFTGFLAAKQDKRIVGINMVQAEDGLISMRDYELHMKMFNYFHKLYPDVKISLHAGELSESLVAREGLMFHIRSAIETAGATRIGHGVSIQHETDYAKLLQTMADNKILVEINLSSNAYILDVKGKAHPLSLYLTHNVPVTLSTDDEGITREDLTQQYQKAVQEFGLSYQTLKMISRNGLAYSFLPGENLWQDHPRYTHINSACKTDLPVNDHLSIHCQQFLNANEKASMQWQLEKRFQAFEARYGVMQSA